jgi:hypothetical protein
MRFKSARHPWRAFPLAVALAAGLGGLAGTAWPADDKPGGHGHPTEERVGPPLPDHELAQIRAREGERAAAARARRLADPALALPEGGDLLVGGNETDLGGVTHTRLQPIVDGVGLYGVVLMVHTGPQGEALRSPAAEGWSFPPLARSVARIDSGEAVRRAHQTLGKGQILHGSKATLHYFPLPSGEPWKLVYVVSTRVAQDDGTAHNWRHAIGAESGEVLQATKAAVDERALDLEGGVPGPESESCFCLRSQVHRLGCGTCPEGNQYSCHMCFSTGGGLDRVICAPTDQDAAALCERACHERARLGNCPFPE